MRSSSRATTRASRGSISTTGPAPSPTPASTPGSSAMTARSGRRSTSCAPRSASAGSSAAGRARAGLEARDELIQPQLLQATADGLELGGAQLDERAPLAAELERLAQPRFAGVQALDDR